MVFYSFNGKTYIRTVPRRRSKGAWSERQVLNRKRFRAISEFWSRFGNSPIREIWMAAVEGQRGNNLFIKTNMPAFGPDGTLIDPERLHFSAGKLPLPYRFMAVKSPVDPSDVEVTWQDDPGSGLARSEDELMMMVGHDGEFTGPVATGALREKESALFQLPSVSSTVQGIYLFLHLRKERCIRGINISRYDDVVIWCGLGSGCLSIMFLQYYNFYLMRN